MSSGRPEPFIDRNLLQEASWKANGPFYDVAIFFSERHQTPAGRDVSMREMALSIQKAINDRQSPCRGASVFVDTGITRGAEIRQGVSHALHHMRTGTVIMLITKEAAESNDAKWPRTEFTASYELYEKDHIRILPVVIDTEFDDLKPFWDALSVEGVHIDRNLAIVTTLTERKNTPVLPSKDLDEIRDTVFKNAEKSPYWPWGQYRVDRYKELLFTMEERVQSDPGGFAESLGAPRQDSFSDALKSICDTVLSKRVNANKFRSAFRTYSRGDTTILDRLDLMLEKFDEPYSIGTMWGSSPTEAVSEVSQSGSDGASSAPSGSNSIQANTDTSTSNSTHGTGAAQASAANTGLVDSMSPFEKDDLARELNKGGTHTMWTIAAILGLEQFDVKRITPEKTDAAMADTIVSMCKKRKVSDVRAAISKAYEPRW